MAGENITAEATGPSGAVVTYDSGPLTCTPPSGSTFPLGATTVTCVDADGNPADSFTVTVVDTTPPALTTPGDVSATSTTGLGVPVSYTEPTATDLVDGAVATSCSHHSGDTFPVGTTSVNCSATDSRGNGGSASFNVIVTVVDTTPPVLSGVPADISETTESPAGKVVNYSKPTATDNIDGTIPVTCAPDTGATFPVGHTTVNCSATDAHGNTGTASFNVDITLVDTTPPTFSGVPSEISETTESPTGKVVNYTKPSATDNVDGPVPVTCIPDTGATFPIGTTPVNCTATDAHGNLGSASFNVVITLVDTTPPAFSDVPSDISETTESPTGKVVNYPKPTANDNLDGPVPVTCTPDTGATFPIGTTLVTCTATDAHSNTGQVSFTITITLVDTTKPVLSEHPDIVETTEVNAPKTVTYSSPTANDNIDGPLPVSCTPPSGSSFPISPPATTVTCSATDTHGNTGVTTFTVTVTLVDTTKPVFSGVPQTIAENTEVLGGKVVNYTVPTAHDNLDGPRPVTCTPAPGTNFPIGTTQVKCTASDTRGNVAEATFNVVITLIDITKPVLTNVPADITTEANGPNGSKANFTTPTAVDNLDGPIANVSCKPASGSTFPLGTTKVVCSATDLHGNTGTANFKVNVVDTTPPTLSPPGDTSVYATLETGSYALDEGPISRFVHGAHAGDIADPNPRLSSDAPVFFVVGTTTVKFTATDASGNTTSATAKLTVLPKPAPGTTPAPLPPPKDNIPPRNVQGLTAKAGNGKATIAWASSTEPDFDHYEVFRSTSPAFKAAGALVYQGTRASFTDRGLRNGIEYRYVVVSVDKAGNSSAGVAIVVVPKKSLLRTPADGARLKTIPKRFLWQRDPRATYYNLQLYAGGTLLFTSTGADPKKILSVFPTKPFYRFKSPWKWQGRSYRMTKGLYTWFVWPGYGARAEVNYGPLMGSATFQLTPAKSRKKR